MYMWVYGMMWIYLGVYGLYVLDNAPGRCAELPPRAWPPVVVEKSARQKRITSSPECSRVAFVWWRCARAVDALRASAWTI